MTAGSPGENPNPPYQDDPVRVLLRVAFIFTVCNYIWLHL